MRTGDALAIFSQIINFVIFLYFTVTLLKLDVLDTLGLIISAFGLLASLITNIISTIDTKYS